MSLFFSASIGSGLPCSHQQRELAPISQDVFLVMFTAHAGIFHDAPIIFTYYKKT